MRFMVMVRADECSEAGGMPSSEMLAAMGKFNEEMVKAGVMLAGEGLHPSKRGTRLKFSGAAPTVIDGPFPAKELVCGFWILQVTSKEEAIEWMKRAPFGGGAQIEIRQVFEAEDFGPDFTCEMREKEEHMRAEIAKRQ
ncbi:MAG: YciI family protein [Alphaproteobacteria bacterium]|nr:YciI family protein [Alphaproteobacteria bacterium]MBV9586352.1 YciI family protein [Alphaproteobacteria bacterium]MBV9965168.1 YciI family protein [Alphaproteobacteria bacterium]